uniref:receptor-like protein 7 n=1 Tax=Erigeron canadensis TaxID=72917 RepID=UPI001CB9BEC4|nr:receptor-like protein 7 [Erigeron canadensis]
MIGLFLYQNKIEGLVPEWIWNNSQETLHLIGLSNNFITGFHQNSQFLPWIHLEVFEISNNQLQGELVIPPQTTVVYDLSNNILIGEIPESICKLKSLRVLDLSSNNMTGTLPPCLGSYLSMSLLVLNLKGNNFHGPMISFVYGCLLKRIDFSENLFTGQVSRSLANCTNLEFLSLGDNSFQDLFSVWLGSLNELQVLTLRSNKFYGTIDQGLKNISSNFLKLRIIDLSRNNFSGELPGKSFQTWNAMKSVYVGNSSAMGFDLPFNTVPPFDFRYTMKLIHKGVKREYLKILNIFIAIDLCCNKFEGQIPHSLQDLHGLEFLNLSNNLLTGRILPSLGNLKNLESLDLSQNQLSGEISRQLLQLRFLSILNVSFNHLDGRIPQGNS